MLYEDLGLDWQIPIKEQISLITKRDMQEIWREVEKMKLPNEDFYLSAVKVNKYNTGVQDITLKRCYVSNSKGMVCALVHKTKGVGDYEKIGETETITVFFANEYGEIKNELMGYTGGRGNFTVMMNKVILLINSTEKNEIKII
jgi:hypothetical protein